ncbi:DUF7556 family protein [Halosolutus gelatinilyticus]|uniref:DUF7556 family protein n=1 Tax=Halosolutus gelatinilyticus TaxID=2931975 RepID=UPI001FF58763|nr:hypothetical protein [Halosolutus gelatinilyticus]
MKPDLESIGDGLEGAAEVVGAIDEIEGRQHFVLADITCDDVWMTVPEDDAMSIDEWR